MLDRINDILSLFGYDPQLRLQTMRRFRRHLFGQPGTPQPAGKRPKSKIQRKKTLCIDLDETLVHTTMLPSLYTSSFKIEVNSLIYHVYKRPHVDKFLYKCAQWFNLVVYTASTQKYADPVVDWLELTSGILFFQRFYRDVI